MSNKFYVRDIFVYVTGSQKVSVIDCITQCEVSSQFGTFGISWLVNRVGVVSPKLFWEMRCALHM